MDIGWRHFVRFLFRSPHFPSTVRSLQNCQVAQGPHITVLHAIETPGSFLLCSLLSMHHD